MTRLRGSRASPPQAIFYGVVCALAGVVFAGLGLFAGSQTLAFVLRARPATGTVIRLAQTGTVFHPVIDFTTAAGESVVITDTQGTNPPAHNLADQVEVLYLPDQPEHAQENSFLNLWLSPVLPLGFGAFWLITGGFMLVDGVTRLRKS
jgi:Protein of unknown function (DUF3592)